MYLSRVELNPNRRETIQAIAFPSIIHGAVEQSFVGSRERNLWRIDWLDEKCYLLVASVQKPEFSHLLKQFGFIDQTDQWVTKSYDNLLTRIKEGDSWRFRLKANPVQSSMKSKNEKSGRGKLHAHVTKEQQRAWLMERSGKFGFSLQEESFDIVHSQWDQFPKSRKGETYISIRSAIYEGVLTVTDSELFKHTLISGIGKAKAYGCGLLTVMK